MGKLACAMPARQAGLASASQATQSTPASGQVGGVSERWGVQAGKAPQRQVHQPRGLAVAQVDSPDDSPG